MHTIRTDVRIGLIEIEVEGFWTIDHVAEFARDIVTQVRAVRALGKQQVVLYDYTKAAIQSQEVVAALQALARNDAFKSRKVALYTGSMLARTQAMRIAAAGHQIKVFDERAKALEWLLAE